ncbi:hypothetical protein BLA24_05345 [Streptomyces cinnamoneus]|uniref:Repetin n=1 Tax=Streptomyces cinnamoneus TaxID=53446 RepID=A0A2G1XN74_STRCJ|nr:hypothetical protein [Streptomyces cinnamoneus]PHQ52704.1 hypothetical protein BLA24_05345 [Streptomyces cinnamoneus]PPT11797.1 hypothetical protein CYQ11_01805 [Streptomyces cinnamoneus]
MPGILSTPRRRITVGAVAATTAFAALTGLSHVASASASSSSASPHAAGTDAAPAAGTAAKEKQTGPAKVSGEGRIFYAYSPDDDIRFSVDATAAPFSRPVDQLPKGMPSDARGTVAFSHWVAKTKETRRAEAAVDCLVTAGDTATLTAVITKSADPREIGTRYGFSVKNGGPGKGRFGFHWGVSNVDIVDGKTTAPRVGTCMAPAPFAPVTQGGLKVTHGELPPLPEGWQPGR